MAATVRPAHRTAPALGRSSPAAPLALLAARWSERGRRRLAEGYELACARAAKPAHAGFTPQVPVRRAAVRALRPELLRIAQLLRAPAPPPRAGVRAARALLSDGNGPLYCAGDLDAAVRAVLGQLEHGSA